MRTYITTFLILALSLSPLTGWAQDSDSEDSSEAPKEIEANAGPSRHTYANRVLSFDISESTIPEGVQVKEVLWNFGDGVRTTGEQVTHAYTKPGTYTVDLNITTENDSKEASTEVRVFKDVMLLIADTSAEDDQLQIYQQQAAKEDILLFTIKSKNGGPEALTEEELTNLLLDARDVVNRSSLIITWTSGGVGANVLSKFSQRVKQAQDNNQETINVGDKGIIMLSDTPFGLLAPVAQSTFDQLQPIYVLLTRPQALSLLVEEKTPEDAKTALVESPIAYRILGDFSSRTVRDIGITNFLSFGINYLVNKGVPINNIILILMLPIIATILAFSRQVIGIKAFGIITPALTTLTFLVMGLQYGLIVFGAILISGTLTRLVIRGLHLLYLPRMALVLCSTSLSILLLFGISVVTGQTPILAFSIFPILILALLAEEFIALQFKSGAKTAFTITAWTLLLSIACYYIVSWQVFRTIIISYPEVVVLCFPINIMIGRFTGLRVTEYFRFKNLLRYIQ